MTTKERSKTIRFNSEIRSIEKVNPLFSRAVVRVLYTGLNRNGSYFSKDSVLKSIDSIYNIPLVGEYVEHTNNFGDHGASLKIKNDEIQLVSSTKPYGVVPESANIYWEDVTEKDGSINEYLVVDGAYLWTGRYEELDALLEQPFNQSMEIEVVNGKFAVIDGVETFDVEEFLFSALCILGVDKNGEGHVEPAFESANITAYSLDKESFKNQFNQMVAELKFSLAQGGNEMTKEKKEKVVSDYEKNKVETESEIEKDSTGKSSSESSVETSSAPTLSDDPKTEDNADASESIVDKSEVVFEDTGGEVDPESEPAPPTDPEPEPEPAPEDIPLTPLEPSEEIIPPTPLEPSEKIPRDDDDNTSATKVKKKPVDFEVEYNNLKENHEALVSDYEILKGQLSELQSYKRQREESDLQTKFEGKLSKEEFDKVFSDSKESSLESIEKDIFALIGQKNFSIQQVNKESANRISIASRVDDSAAVNPYSALEIYTNK